MAATQISTKRLAITKANAQMVIFVAVASFITVFCLIASKDLLSQNAYQAKIISKKSLANSVLKQNIQTFSSLSSSYQNFVSQSNNIIGGSSSGSGNNDGANNKIILDALPSNYDFPALTSSLEKILSNQGVTITNIGGTDDQLNQQTNLSSPSPQAVPIPFTFSIGNGSYSAVQQLLAKLQQSIRPIAVDTFEITGGNTNMTLNVTAHTYYQPAKTLSITKETIK